MARLGELHIDVEAQGFDTARNAMRRLNDELRETYRLARALGLKKRDVRKLIAVKIKESKLPKDDIRNPKHNPYELLFKWLYRFGRTKMEVVNNHLRLDGLMHFPASDKMIKIIKEENAKKIKR